MTGSGRKEIGASLTIWRLSTVDGGTAPPRDCGRKTAERQSGPCQKRSIPASHVGHDRIAHLVIDVLPHSQSTSTASTATASEMTFYSARCALMASAQTEANPGDATSPSFVSDDTTAHIAWRTTGTDTATADLPSDPARHAGGMAEH